MLLRDNAQIKNIRQMDVGLGKTSTPDSNWRIMLFFWIASEHTASLLGRDGRMAYGDGMNTGVGPGNGCPGPSSHDQHHQDEVHPPSIRWLGPLLLFRTLLLMVWGDVQSVITVIY
jgi:hypothetical protein